MTAENPLKTENLVTERLDKVKALAVFSSDILSVCVFFIISTHTLQTKVYERTISAF